MSSLLGRVDQAELDHLREHNNGITESKQYFEIAQKLIRGLNITPNGLPESFQRRDRIWNDFRNADVK